MISFDTYDETELLRQKLDVLKASQEIGWQEEAIRCIRKARCALPDLELDRLRSWNILTPTKEELFDHALGKIFDGSHANISSQITRSFVQSIQILLNNSVWKARIIQTLKSLLFLKTDEEAEAWIKAWLDALWTGGGAGFAPQVRADRSHVKMLMAQALEIQEIYKSTHHVFVHAQHSSWLICPDLIKELMKVHNPGQSFSGFKFLRAPTNRPWDITKYSQAEQVMDHEKEARLDLISADGYFYHHERYESAMHFLSGNQSISAPSIEIIEDILYSFYPEMPSDTAAFYAHKVIEQIHDDPSQIGNLFVLCIPKEKSLEIQYRAHPYGDPCGCHFEASPIDILEQLQEGILNEDVACDWYDCPQYRIFTPALTIENGVKSYLLTSEKSFRKTLKERIRSVVQEMHAHFMHPWGQQQFLA